MTLISKAIDRPLVSGAALTLVLAVLGYRHSFFVFYPPFESRVICINARAQHSAGGFSVFMAAQAGVATHELSAQTVVVCLVSIAGRASGVRRTVSANENTEWLWEQVIMALCGPVLKCKEPSFHSFSSVR